MRTGVRAVVVFPGATSALNSVNAMSAHPCSLSEYRRIVSALPRPSPRQVDNFVQFVSSAHSWYKHLPLLPPGVPFCFFLNPFSGYDIIHRPGGAVEHRERTDSSQRFHYTWMTTRRYRTRFGHLDYSARAGTQFLLRSSESLYEYAHLPRFLTESSSHHLPPEVAAVGSVALTGVISQLAPRVFVWTRILQEYNDRHPSNPPRRWPPETGGDPTLHKILDVCERAMHPSSELDSDGVYKSVEVIEGELAALLRPEKERLQAEMTRAIHRVLDLVYPPPGS